MKKLKKILNSRWIENSLRYLLGVACVFFVQNIIQQHTIKHEDIASRMQEITELLQENYYGTGEIDIQKMEDSALKAYVDGLEDPYTIYLDTSSNSGFQESIKGQSDFE